MTAHISSNVRRGLLNGSGLVFCTILCLWTTRASGELEGEELMPFGEDPGVKAAGFSSNLQAYREVWLRYVAGKESPGKLDTALKKLVAQAFWSSTSFSGVMKKLEGTVRWQEMPEGELNAGDILPGDRPLSPLNQYGFLGAIVFDADTLPVVFYTQPKLKSGAKLIVLQDFIPVESNPFSKMASRKLGDLYAAMGSGKRARMAAISGHLGEISMCFYEPVRLLDVIETPEAGPVVAYMYGPVGNGNYAYMYMRRWQEASGCWEYVGERGDWDDVECSYDKARKLLTIEKMNSPRWGGNGVSEYQTVNLEQRVKEAAQKSTPR